MMKNEFEYTFLLKVCQNLNFLYGIDAWVSSFPTLENVGANILNRTPKFKPMEVMPFVSLLKDYVRAFFHLKKQPTIDKIRMRIVIVREKSDQKPI